MGFKELSAGIAALMSCLLAVAPAVASEKGPVTKLPLPRFVSMKKSEGNVRRGPNLDQKIDWVFQHKNMPLMITAEYGHWRRVEDIEGQGGWMHYSLLSGNRTVILREPDTALRLRPNEAAAAVAVAEGGVIASLGECSIDWCEVEKDGYEGWASKSAMWGVMPQELRD